MLRLIKKFSWVALLAASLQASFGYSDLGPWETWQTAPIGYQLAGDVGGPMNFAEGYRRNVPVQYYAFDPSFMVYFGLSGAAEVDKAYAVFNNLQNASQYSVDMSELPMETHAVNWTAEALYMLDIKSMTMALMMEQLGAAEPERYTWTLRSRWLPTGGKCPLDEEYVVVQRNFDPVLDTSASVSPGSPYVNGTLYTYYIEEFCAPPNPLAITVPFPVDPLADIYTAVASMYGQFVYGGYFTDLTRDDVAALRHMLRTNNVALESPGPNTTVFNTNWTLPQVLYTSNLLDFVTVAATNDAAGMMAAYPGLVDVSTFDHIAIVGTTNWYVAYYTNYPWAPYPTATTAVLASNVTYTPVTYYKHQFGNIFTISTTPGGGVKAAPLLTIPKPNGFMPVTLQTITIGPAGTTSPYSPLPVAGATTVLTTNITSRTVYVKAILGDFFIPPAGSCAMALQAILWTNVTTITNVLVAPTATNALTTTTTTNASSQTYELDAISTRSSRIILAYPVTCDPAPVGLYQGVEKITFLRRDYDSYLNRFWAPVTNYYTLYSITNYAIVPKNIQRVVTQPDFLFSAADLINPPTALPVIDRTPPAYNATYAIGGLAGPGTIESPAVFTFDIGAPAWENYGLTSTNAYLSQNDQVTIFVWGSYDGTTNPPAIYPNNMTIADLETQMLIQVTPQDLPDAQVGVAYKAQLQTQSFTADWVAPYTWALAPGSPALPLGFTFDPPGADPTTGTAATAGPITISTDSMGPPQPGMQGFYDFIIGITDAQGHYVQRTYSIRINP